MALNNSCKRRLTLASQKLANFLNNCVFGLCGPMDIFSKTLGATGKYKSMCLLAKYLSKGYSRPIFPLSDNDVAGGPLVKDGYNALRHLAIGLLRVFDANLNSTQPGGEPYFNWHDEEGQHMLGAGDVPPYGPMSTHIWNHSLAMLCPKYKSLLETAITTTGVSHAVASRFNR